MSENLDLVRWIFASWERGDFTLIEWADPAIELVMVDGPAPGSWNGVGGMDEGWRDFLGAWDAWRVAAERYYEADGERILVLGRFSGHGTTSGLELNELSSNGASLFHVRSGKVTRLAIYRDRERAIADMGLAE
jgi:ketosteroid isomerase-like protein